MIVLLYDMSYIYDLNLHCQRYPHNTAHYYNYGLFKSLVEKELVKYSENRKGTLMQIWKSFYLSQIIS